MATNLKSLRLLLDNDKMLGPNLDSWFRKLKIVLEHEGILYVIQDPAPKEPAPDDCSAVRDTYLKWVSDRITVRCIMRAAMSDELSCIFEEAQPEEILQVLKESFGTPDDIEQHKSSCTVFNAQMGEGALVTNHVLYMIEQIRCLGKAECPLHEQLKKVQSGILQLHVLR